jgi:putative transcription factor
MPSCEMCGREAELFKAIVEGAPLEVCGGCARFGKIVSKPQLRNPEKKQFQRAPMPKRKEVVELISQDYSEKIRNAREKLGLTQEEFSKKLNERESFMQKIESGQMKPSIDMARKLEKELHIILVENFEEGEVPIETPKSKADGFTLGDFIKDKRKK